MSQVVIEELALMILVGDDSFEVFINQSPDSNALFAEVHLRRSTPFTVAQLLANERLEGDRLTLESQDFVAADMELRGILLRNNLNITTTQYWCGVSDSGTTENLYLEDCDPDTHTTVEIGNYTRSFSPDQASSTDFIGELLRSGLCEGWCWNGSDIQLTLPPSLVTDENRGETFKTLMSLYRPGS